MNKNLCCSLYHNKILAFQRNRVRTKEVSRDFGRVCNTIHSIIRRLLVPMDKILRSFPHQGKVAIDLGCGQGVFLGVLSDRFEKVFGVDFDPKNCRTASARAGSRAEIHCADVVSFIREFEDVVDFILVSDLLASLPIPDQEYLISRFSKVISNDGTVILKIVDTKPHLKKLINNFIIFISYKVLRVSATRERKFFHQPSSGYSLLATKYGMTAEIIRLDRWLPIPHVIVRLSKPKTRQSD